ncbi:hypothetical protein Vi05172_g2177 [Venturia inaequalis]|nr:hypothetical protein Vi05172_g2177 [Venturia inaequalis]
MQLSNLILTATLLLAPVFGCTTYKRAYPLQF